MVKDCKILFGCVADDYTGASDEACMLTNAGLSTGLFLWKPGLNNLKLKSTRYDAIVIGVQTRSISPTKAKRTCRECFDLFKKVGANPVQFKYCSTFDSTEKGNIGPVIEEGLKCFNQKMTIAVPALPVNNRTTYMGYHFVGDKLLSDSHMRHHPLNPMSESNLVAFLSRQTSLKVGLANLNTVRQGVKKLKEYFKSKEDKGVNILVIDCIEDEDLKIIMSASKDLSFLSGGSGIGTYINSYYGKRKGDAKPKPRAKRHIKDKHIGALIVSGSCSEQTLRQNEYALAHGFFLIQLNILKLIRSRQTTINNILNKAKSLLLKGRNVLISSSQSLEKRKKYVRITKDFRRLGFEISSAFAEVVKNILDRTNCKRLIVSGGETSGSIIKACNLNFFEVLTEISPGVPLIYSPEKDIFTVLKSGNFGSIDLYSKALKAMEGNT